MTERKRVPAIRFKGFTEDWEQRKLEEFLTESRIIGHSGDIARKLTVKLWAKGVVEKNDWGGSVNTQYYIRKAGQFVYSKLDFLNCAFGVIPSDLDGYETTTDIPAFDLYDMNSHFLFYLVIQERFYKKNGAVADGSRKAKRIHVHTFLKMPIFKPILSEQIQISNLLSSLDTLITLHQRKVVL